MKRLVLPIIMCILAVPLVLAAGAQARLWEPGAPSQEDAAREALMQYVAQVAPVYAELKDCACCCGKIDLPARRFGGDPATIARLTSVKARAHQALRRVDGIAAPQMLATAHAELLAALDTMRHSSEYMLAKAWTAPQELLTATFVAPPRGRGGVAVVYRPSPQIVAKAEVAAMSAQERFAFIHHDSMFAHEGAGGTHVYGTPGEQALAHLIAWRTAIVAQARALNVSLSRALAD
jgi:hypothetical protein